MAEKDEHIGPEGDPKGRDSANGRDPTDQGPAPQEDQARGWYPYASEVSSMFAAFMPLRTFALRVEPDVPRRTFPVIDGQGEDIRLGWVEFPWLRGQGISIGAFYRLRQEEDAEDRDSAGWPEGPFRSPLGHLTEREARMTWDYDGKPLMFVPFAFADLEGRVFLQEPWQRPTANMFGSAPCFVLLTQAEIALLKDDSSRSNRVAEAIRDLRCAGAASGGADGDHDGSARDGHGQDVPDQDALADSVLSGLAGASGQRSPWRDSAISREWVSWVARAISTMLEQSQSQEQDHDPDVGQGERPDAGSAAGSAEDGDSGMRGLKALGMLRSLFGSPTHVREVTAVPAVASPGNRTGSVLPDPTASVPFADRFHPLSRTGLLRGSMIMFDSTKVIIPVGSWVRDNPTGRYSLGDIGLWAPEGVLRGVGYRDAITSAFLYACFVPSVIGEPVGFGAQTILYRLRRFAPMAAIGRSLNATQEGLARGLQVSGFDWFFAHLVRESRAATDPNLQADRVLEPLQLQIVSDSGEGSGDFAVSTPGNGLEPTAAAHALRLESALNRFAHVAKVDSWRAFLGSGASQESRATASVLGSIDRGLIENPALIAFRTPGDDMEDGKGLDEARMTGFGDPGKWRALVDETVSGTPAHSDDWWRAVLRFRGIAREEWDRQYARAAQDVREEGMRSVQFAPSGQSEWVYRHTMARLLAQLRLPYRLSASFHSCVRNGKVALLLLGADGYMMPESVMDGATGKYRPLSRKQRNAMSVDYNLRIAIMAAALAFYANDSIREVLVWVDGLDFSSLSNLQRVDAQQGVLPGFVLPPDTSGEGVEADAFQSRQEEAESEVLASRNAFGGNPAPSGAGQSGGGEEGRNEEGHGNGTDGSEEMNYLIEDLQRMLSGQGARSFRTQGKGAPKDHDVHGQPGAADGSAVPSSGDSADGSASSGGVRGTGSDGPDGQVRQSSDSDSVAGAEADADETASLGHDGAAADGREGGSDSDDRSAATAGDGADERNRSASMRRPKATIRFTRALFLRLLGQKGLKDPRGLVSHFRTTMDLAPDGSMRTITPDEDTGSMEFRPSGAGQVPERLRRVFTPVVARILGTGDTHGLAIEREYLVEESSTELQTLGDEVSNGMLDSVTAARQATDIVERTNDPELIAQLPEVTSALIDRRSVPELRFTYEQRITAGLRKVQSAALAGRLAQGDTESVKALLGLLDGIDHEFSSSGRVPRYFNSYADRVIYNRLFAVPGERMVLIPDALFFCGQAVSDLVGESLGADAKNDLLNRLVRYAPTYARASAWQSAALAQSNDWEGASAAALNALRVSQDGDDAAYAYYLLAYAQWMMDRPTVAAACYRMSGYIHPNLIASLQGEFESLRQRCLLQGIEVPDSEGSAVAVLQASGVPVWPDEKVAAILHEAAMTCVDDGLFIPAQTIARAEAKMQRASSELSMSQELFVQSLGR